VSHIHEKVTFEGTHGQLSGNLHVPAGHIRAGVVLAHCFTCSKSYKIIRRLATGIESGGYAVLRFDFTGLGESEGEFADASVTTYVGDLEAAAHYMQQRSLGSCVMVGHSLGGAAALLAAKNVPQVRAVVTVAAPATADHVRNQFSAQHVDAPSRLRRSSSGISNDTARSTISHHSAARSSWFTVLAIESSPSLRVRGYSLQLSNRAGSPRSRRPITCSRTRFMRTRRQG
jgi:alpha/beta superfamily hydrolase